MKQQRDDLKEKVRDIRQSCLILTFGLPYILSDPMPKYGVWLSIELMVIFFVSFLIPWSRLFAQKRVEEKD